MECLGIYMDPETRAKFVNPELVAKHGASMVDNNNFGGDPEFLRQLVERGLRQNFSHVTVKFFDMDAELELEAAPDHNYGLIIKREAPIYSRSMH